MTAAFAALETRINAAALAHCANALATLPGGSTVEGIFGSDYDEAQGVSGRDMVFRGPSSQLDGLTYGASISVGATEYTVRSAQPDGAGYTRLVLESD